MLGIAMIPSRVATINSCSKDNNSVENDLRMGGDWTTRKDYQHFELIESPAEVKFPFALSDE